MYITWNLPLSRFLRVQFSGFNCLHSVVQPCLRCIVTFLVSEALLWLKLVVQLTFEQLGSTAQRVSTPSPHVVQGSTIFYSTLNQDTFLLNYKKVSLPFLDIVGRERNSWYRMVNDFLRPWCSRSGLTKSFGRCCSLIWLVRAEIGKYLTE